MLPAIVLDELRRVSVDKLGFDAAHVRAAHDLLTGIATAVPGPSSFVDAVTGDPADDKILACAVAVAAEVDVLATGDRNHLLPVGARHGVRIITPQALLAELRASG